MNTTLKRMQLQFLFKMGFRYWKAKSNFDVPYLISLGDFFSQNPFYKPEINSEEIISCVAWCLPIDRPVIYDIGAHCGYFCAHFATLLQSNNPRIYSFEPVTLTFFDLLKTISQLDISGSVIPIHAALSDKHDIVTLNYSKWESMLAHIIPVEKNESANSASFIIALSTTADQVATTFGTNPDLLKLDVEGYESFVLKGASSILRGEKSPAICIEWNPGTLAQCGSSTQELASALKGYDLYYLNDYELKGIKFLEKIKDVQAINWVCNLFAVPSESDKIVEWKNNIEKLKKQYSISI